jgi:hypothetical protein
MDGGDMYRIQNLGIPNNRTHQVPTNQIIKGGRKISDDKVMKREYLDQDGKSRFTEMRHLGVTYIEPNRSIVEVTDELGKKLEKYPEINVVEKVADKKG